MLGLVYAPPSPAQASAALPGACGEVVAVETHGRTTTRYALAYPQAMHAEGARIAMVLLAGGGGHLDLDEQGCPRALKGNSLVRSLPLFRDAGFITALVDTPSDYKGDEGLGAFRVSTQHADDLGKVIADVRERTKASVWVVGTSRGAISAVNAASRLAGPALPDGVVLTSALMVGSTGRTVWTAHTVFDLPLEAIKSPVLVIGHEADRCLRSPASLMGRIVARTNGAREQVVVVTGGPGTPGAVDLNACEGRTPHGFLEQEAEVAAGMARFIRGGSY
jgi:hypothetical protein